MTKNLLSAGIILLFCGSIANAQIIYSNDFTLGGASNIWGTAPTAANTFAGGSSSATWRDVLGINDVGSLLANGIDNTASPDSWVLPFNPQSGYVYLLTVSLTFTGNPGSLDWVGLGFAQNDSTNVPMGDGRFADSANGGPNGYDWMLDTESSGNVQFFAGPKGSIPQIYSGLAFTPGPQTLTNQVILDTTGSQWSIAAYLNGTQLGPTTNYATSPPIGAVGITQTTLSTTNAIRWNYLTLVAGGTVRLAPPVITFSASGNQLTLSWLTNYSGWLLQSNAISLATTNWSVVPGSGSTNRLQITIQPGLTNLFYRLSSP